MLMKCWSIVRFDTPRSVRRSYVFDLVVARDGIEPQTPAFSGLLTDQAKWFRISAS